MKSSKNITLYAAFALAAASLSATAANAADIPSRHASPPPVPIVAPPVFTWTGFYIGANAGWAGGARDRPSVFVTPPATGGRVGGLGGNSFVGGLQAGYNWQMGNVVLGLETDIQARAGGRGSFGPVTLPDGTIATGRHGGNNWYGTLRPRIGYAIDRTLIYATGGLAYGEGRNRISTIDPAGNTAILNSSNMRYGWTAGAGVEYALTRNWSAKLEYGYVNLGRNNLSGAVFTPAGLATGAVVTSRNTDSFHTIKAGINYRF